eukprot:111926_1
MSDTDFSHIHVSHKEARTGLILTILAVTPFILRSFGDWIVSFILRKCCNMTKQEMKVQIIGKGDSLITIDNIFERRFRWSEAREQLGLNTCAALFISLIRLIFWHCMQPCLYCFVMYAYWDLLDRGQQILAVIVAVRECIYFCLTFIGVCVNPTFLLIDLRASWKDDRGQTLLYIMGPEKYVWFSIGVFDTSVCGQFFFGTVLIILVIADTGGIVAFVWAFVVRNVYIPMMIGYTVTALGALYIALLFCIGFVADFCGINNLNVNTNNLSNIFPDEKTRIVTKPKLQTQKRLII